MEAVVITVEATKVIWLRWNPVGIVNRGLRSNQKDSEGTRKGPRLFADGNGSPLVHARQREYVLWEEDGVTNDLRLLSSRLSHNVPNLSRR